MEYFDLTTVQQLWKNTGSSDWQSLTYSAQRLTDYSQILDPPTGKRLKKTIQRLESQHYDFPKDPYSLHITLNQHAKYV